MSGLSDEYLTAKKQFDGALATFHKAAAKEFGETHNQSFVTGWAVIYSEQFIDEDGDYATTYRRAAMDGLEAHAILGLLEIGKRGVRAL